MVGRNAGNSSLTERDYIFGFSETEAGRKQRSDVGLKCEDTELRLGIGPALAASNSSSSSGPGFLSKMADVAVAADQRLQSSLEALDEENHGMPAKLAGALSTGAAAGAFTAPPSVQNHVFWPWPGLAPGPFMIPIPKVCSGTVPAKRPYVDVAADQNSNKIAMPNSLMPSSNLDAGLKPTAMAAASPKGGGGAYPSFSTWTNVNNHLSNNMSSNVTVAPPWHPTQYSKMSSAFEQEAPAACPSASSAGCNGMVGFSSNSAALLRAFQPQQAAASRPASASTTGPPCSAAFKIPPSPAAQGPDSNSANASKAVESRVRPHVNDEATRNKAPVVVGWPPVRSFRKNTLHAASAHGSKTTEDKKQDCYENGKSETGDTEEPKAEVSEAHNNMASSSSGLQATSAGAALFVKAKLDGIRICRKVDLKAYDSYESLKSGLQDMFQAFCSDHIAKLDLLEGKNYVLTHEDKDGDWMLVGDVPWHMFVDSTVKSFRIMKAADATGLGERVYAKQKAQDSGKL